MKFSEYEKKCDAELKSNKDIKRLELKLKAEKLKNKILEKKWDVLEEKFEEARYQFDAKEHNLSIDICNLEEKITAIKSKIRRKYYGVGYGDVVSPETIVKIISKVRHLE